MLHEACADLDRALALRMAAAPVAMTRRSDQTLSLVWRRKIL
jgi:hypothetical protein